MERNISCSPGRRSYRKDSVPIALVSDLSIFISSTSSAVTRLRLEYPVPKSSMANLTPWFLYLSMWIFIPSKSPPWRSVISRRIVLYGMLYSEINPSSLSLNFSESRSLGLMFTLKNISFWIAVWINSRIAWLMTNKVTSSCNPSLSESGINTSGLIFPSLSSFHLSKASNPQICPSSIL